MSFAWASHGCVISSTGIRTPRRRLYVFCYRDKQWEVDFVIAKSGKVEQLIQVSYDISAEKTLNREINALLKAATKFHCENLLLINFDEDREVEKNGYTIRMIPAAEWLTRQ